MHDVKADFHTAIIPNRKRHNFSRRFSGNKEHITTLIALLRLGTARNDTVYHATFLYRTASLTDILQKTLPIYLLIWLFALYRCYHANPLSAEKVVCPTERILQSRKDFVATASHELKSPLAVMISNTDMLLDNVSLNEQARQAGLQTIDLKMYTQFYPV